MAVRERRSWQRREPYLVAVRTAHHGDGARRTGYLSS